MNPPPGCPFQTRCHRKIGLICETELPPVKELAPGHKIMCHLPDAELREMEPVIVITKKNIEVSDTTEILPGASGGGPRKQAAAKKPAIREALAKTPQR